MEIAHWGKVAFIPVLALLTNLRGTFWSKSLTFLNLNFLICEMGWLNRTLSRVFQTQDSTTSKTEY